jgi:hypothetical protein
LGEVIWPLVVLGVILIGVGLKVPGTHSNTASLLVVFGCSMLSAGMAAPWFKKLRLPGGAEFEGEEGPDPAPWLEVEKKTMIRVAQLTLNDNTKRAKTTVKKALGQARRYRSQTPPRNRDTTAYRTLVMSLKRADEGIWFNGSQGAAEPRNGVEALQLVEFWPRIAYVLGRQMRTKDVATILERPEAEIEAEIELCRSTIAPYVQLERGPGA